MDVKAAWARFLDDGTVLRWRPKWSAYDEDHASREYEWATQHLSAGESAMGFPEFIARARAEFDIENENRGFDIRIPRWLLPSRWTRRSGGS